MDSICIDNFSQSSYINLMGNYIIKKWENGKLRTQKGVAVHRCSLKHLILKNITKLTGKHERLSHFFN